MSFIDGGPTEAGVTFCLSSSLHLWYLLVVIIPLQPRPRLAGAGEEEAGTVLAELMEGKCSAELC